MFDLNGAYHAVAGVGLGGHACMLSRVWLFATLWTVACQAPLSTGFSRQEYWSRLPFPAPGDLPYPGIKPVSPALAGRFFTTEPPRKPRAVAGWFITMFCRNSGAAGLPSMLVLNFIFKYIFNYLRIEQTWMQYTLNLNTMTISDVLMSTGRLTHSKEA